ncbi:MAG: ABC transporter ATP-binding protein [Acidimicrobiaceae bacterium]|nr:ABC transporter ATP-binding protein [Chloroflexota bacterium]MYB27979.1 ABC transporter ATP-binding protein [Acidimicrobiaceae bacterium]
MTPSGGSAGSMLSIRNLQVSFAFQHGTIVPVDGVDLDLGEGEVLGIAGESGSGKSLTLRSIIGLLPRGASATGDLRFSVDGGSPAAYDPAEVRGRSISMVFQEPVTALNPTMRVGDLVSLGIRLRGGRSKRRARTDAIDLMRQVGIPMPGRRARAWPHELSGGLRQRVMIATALSTRPRLLLCDEPTTALDVTVQRQILNLLSGLVAELGMSMIFVTHDLPVLRQLADRIAVMYAGRIVEVNDTEALFSAPRHPYTHALMRAAPVIDIRNEELAGIGGRPPDPRNFGGGCRFRDRCAHALPECVEASYRLVATSDGAASACIRQLDLAGVR